MFANQCGHRFLVLFPLAFALFAGGCAQQPPNSNNLSGRRITVTITFRNTIDPSQHYYFLINNSNNPNAKGPIPVLGPPYGNGFATAASGQDPNGQAAQGFTDFVEYDVGQPAAFGGYGLYHVIGNPNQGHFSAPVRPLSVVPPSNDQTQSLTSRLQFTIDMSQLAVDANGNPLQDQQAAINAALAIRYLQINIVATSRVPVDATTLDTSKETDSLGNSTNGSPDLSSWLNIDVSTSRTYSNSDSSNPLVEPSFPDEYPSPGSDSPIDITDWTIQVTQQ